VFYVISLIIALIGSIAIRYFHKNYIDKGVPLVGYMALALMACLMINQTTGMFNFYDDSFLLRLMNS
jgi:hypothetical protein